MRMAWHGKMMVERFSDVNSSPNARTSLSQIWQMQRPSLVSRRDRSQSNQAVLTGKSYKTRLLPSSGSDETSS